MQIAAINEQLWERAEEAERLIAPYVKRTEEIAFYNLR